MDAKFCNGKYIKSGVDWVTLSAFGKTTSKTVPKQEKGDW